MDPGDTTPRGPFNVVLSQASRVLIGKIPIQGELFLSWEGLDSEYLSHYEVKVIPDGVSSDDVPAIIADKVGHGSSKFGEFSFGEITYGNGGGGFFVTGLKPNTVYRCAVRSVMVGTGRSNWVYSNSLSTGSEQSPAFLVNPTAQSLYKTIVFTWENNQAVDRVDLEYRWSGEIGSEYVKGIKASEYVLVRDLEDAEVAGVLEFAKFTPFNAEGSAGTTYALSDLEFKTLSQSDADYSDKKSRVEAVITSENKIAGNAEVDGKTGAVTTTDDAQARADAAESSAKDEITTRGLDESGNFVGSVSGRLTTEVAGTIKSGGGVAAGQVDKNALQADSVDSTKIDFGTAAGQVSLDNVPEGSTNKHVIAAEKTAWNSKETGSLKGSGDPNGVVTGIKDQIYYQTDTDPNKQWRCSSDPSGTTWVKIGSDITVADIKGAFDTIVPSPPTNLQFNEVGDSVEISFDLPLDRSNVTHYEVWSSVGASDEFNLVAVVEDEEIPGGDTNATVVDYSYSRKTTIYYRVYSFYNKNRSSALSGSHLITYVVPDPTNFKVVSQSGSFALSWTNPPSRLLEKIVIYKDANSDQGSLSEVTAISNGVIYEGLAEAYTDDVATVEKDNWHQYWISSVTRT